jgi:hypothetical protein
VINTFPWRQIFGNQPITVIEVSSDMMYRWSTGVSLDTDSYIRKQNRVQISIRQEKTGRREIRMEPVVIHIRIERDQISME